MIGTMVDACEDDVVGKVETSETVWVEDVVRRIKGGISGSSHSFESFFITFDCLSFISGKQLNCIVSTYG